VRYLWKFLASAAEERQFPPATVPEIAFLGRSNVGKSSVINSLLGEKVAKTSSTPGRTRTINFFAIRPQGAARAEVIFADLPGYGYAKLPREMTAQWPRFIDPYLKGRRTLALCVCLIDANIPPQEHDKELVEYLKFAGRDILVVATKVDRLSNNQLRNAVGKFGQEFQLSRLLPFSARTGTGREELWKELRNAVKLAATGNRQSAERLSG
jgi:GTP-binding protein